MDPVSEECRLCRDPHAECFTTIESPELKGKMKQVFSFTIVPKQGYCSKVCRSCSDTISEFYQFSEKVRQNQETLDELPIKIEISVENVKIEPTTDSADLLEPIAAYGAADERNEDTWEEEETVQHSSDGDTYEPPPPKKIQTKRTKNRNPSKPESEASSPKEDTKETKEKRDREDQFLTEHFRLACPLCDETMSTFLQIHGHFRMVHDRGDAYVVCCDTKFTHRSTILEHTFEHFNEALQHRIQCELCGEQYSNKQELSVHLSEGKSRYTCDKCPTSFKQRCVFTAHMERHRKLHCVQCNRFFGSNTSLSTHMNYHHSGKDRSKICDICGRKFRTKVGFKNHMDAQHLGIAARFQCEICQRWLKGEKSYKYHMDYAHGPIGKDIQCDICQQNYPHEKALRDHKRLVHVEAKHECEFCGKMFKRQISLKEHRSTHTGEVLYQCEICKHTFSRSSNFYTHQKKKHPVEWAEKALKSRMRSH